MFATQYHFHRNPFQLHQLRDGHFSHRISLLDYCDKPSDIQSGDTHHFLHSLGEAVSDKIKRKKDFAPYSLIIHLAKAGQALPITVLEDMVGYIERCLEPRDNGPVFPFESVALDFSTIACGVEDVEVDAAFKTLIQCLERMGQIGVKRIHCRISHFNEQVLKASQLASLRQCLRGLNQTEVQFTPSLLPLDEVIALEQANREALISERQAFAASMTETLQAHLGGKTSLAIPRLGQTNASVLSLEQRYVAELDAEVVELSMVVAKPNVQRQQQQEQTQEQQASVQKAWKKTHQKKQQAQSAYSMKSKDGATITRDDVVAAMDKSHHLHQMAVTLLGPELVNFHFQDKNLLQMWDCICGDPKLIEQEQRAFMREHSWSKDVINAISKEALTSLLKAPHALLYGLNINNMPSGIGFTCFENGRVFIDEDLTNDHPLALSLAHPQHPDAMMPKRYHQFARMAGLPEFLSGLINVLPDYLGAHHAYQMISRFYPLFLRLSQEQAESIVHRLKDYVATKQNQKLTQLYCALMLSALDNTLTEETKAFSTKDYATLEDELIEDTLAFAAKASFEHMPQHTLLRIFHELTNNAFSDKEGILASLNERGLTRFIELTLATGDNTSTLALITLCQNISQQHGKEGLKVFASCFIDPLQNVQDLLTAGSLEALLSLNKLNAKELSWFYQLATQQVKASGYIELSQYVKAFAYFLNELDTMGLRDKLPLPCPLEHIDNATLGLERLLHLLQNAIDPEEQMRYLDGLDFGLSSVGYLNLTEKYKLVTKEMAITLDEDIAHVELLDRCSRFTHRRRYEPASGGIYNDYKNVSDEDVVALYNVFIIDYYRYIGQEQYTTPFSYYKDYLQIVDSIDQYKLAKNFCGHSDGVREYVTGQTKLVYYLKAKRNLLSIIALLTTGKLNIDNVSPNKNIRLKQIRHMVDTIIQSCTRREYSPEMDKSARQYIDFERLNSYLEHLAHDLSEMERRPTFAEVTMMAENKARAYEQERIAYSDAQKALDKQRGFDREAHARLFERIGDDSRGLLAEFELVSLLPLRPYGQAFCEANVLLNQYNQQAQYAYWIKCIRYLQNQELDKTSIAALLAPLALTPLTRDSLEGDVQLIDTLVLQLKTLKPLLQDEEYALVLQTISQLRTRQDIADIDVQVLNIIITRLEPLIQSLQAGDNKDALLAAFPQGFKQALQPPLYWIHKITAADDALFHQSAEALDGAYPGLGDFYHEIKRFILMQCQTILADEKEASWHAFLNVLAGFKASQIKMILDNLSKNDWQHIELAQLTPLLQRIHENKDNQSIARAFKFLAYIPDTCLKVADNAKLLDAIDALIINNYFYNDTFAKLFFQILQSYQFALKAPEEREGLLTLLYHVDYIELPEQTQFLNCLNDIIINQEGAHGIVGIMNECFDLRHEQAEALKERAQKAGVEFDRGLVLDQSILTDLLKQLNQSEALLGIIQAYLTDDNALLYVTILSRCQLIEGDALKALKLYLNECTLEQLNQLSDLYRQKPYPKKALLQKLINQNISFEDFVASHTVNPHLSRTKAVMDKQFDSLSISKLLGQLQLSDAQKASMLLSLEYVNHIGYHDICHRSSESLTRALHQIRQALRETPALSKEAKRHHLLRAFAIIREMMYRCSKSERPLWPKPIQSVSLLSHINQLVEGDVPTFFQIATGAGKSLIAAMTGMVDWINGHTANIVAHHSGLALRDFKSYEPFYKTLKIPASFIHAGSDSYEYVDGINYAEFMDLALFRQSVILKEGKDLHHLNQDKSPEAIAWIIDEADEMFLHRDMDCNLTGSDVVDDVHPHFAILDEIVSMLSELDGDQTISIAEVKAHLQEKFPQQYKLLHSLAFTQKLKGYIKDAWTAIHLKLGEDYIIRSYDDTVDGVTTTVHYASLIIDDKPMPANVTYTGVIQQCLHLHLKQQSLRQGTNQQYKVPAERRLHSSMSVSAVIDWMLKSQSSMMLFSATCGSEAEQAELHSNYGLDFLDLSRGEKPYVTVYPDTFRSKAHKQFESIYDICKKYTAPSRGLKKRHAVLIPVESIEVAEALMAYLKKRRPELNIETFHAESSDNCDEDLLALERTCATPGKITIATGGFVGRGFDPKFLAGQAHQLILIDTFLHSEDTAKQKLGRAGRYDVHLARRRKGKTFTVYDLESIYRQYPSMKRYAKDATYHPARFKAALYHLIYQEEMAKRLGKQRQTAICNVIQEQFFSELHQCQLMIADIEKDRPELSFDMSKQDSDKFFKCCYTIHLIRRVMKNLCSLFSAYLDKRYQSLPHKPGQLKAFIQESIGQLKILYADMQALLEDELHDEETIRVALQQIFTLKLANIKSSLKNIDKRTREASTHAQDMSVVQAVPYKIDDKWKPGNYTNSYIKQGKQSTWNYFVSSVSTSLFMSKADTQAMNTAHSEKERVYQQKRKDAWRFSDAAVHQCLVVNRQDSPVFQGLMQADAGEEEAVDMPSRLVVSAIETIPGVKATTEQDEMLFIEDHGQSLSLTMVSNDPRFYQGIESFLIRTLADMDFDGSIRVHPFAIDDNEHILPATKITLMPGKSHQLDVAACLQRFVTQLPQSQLQQELMAGLQLDVLTLA